MSEDKINIDIDIEIYKFKNFVNSIKQDGFTLFDKPYVFIKNEITPFGNDIFNKIWIPSLYSKDPSKAAFLENADKYNIPVIDYDKNDLSFLGKYLFSIWCEASKGINYDI